MLLSIAQQDATVNPMDFAHSSRAADLAERVRTFVDTEVLPAEEVITADILARRARGADPWTVHPLIEELKTKARSGGLWNLFLPEIGRAHV